MRYHKPFTPQQRREALLEYESFRRHVRQLRSTFAPGTADERRTLNRYRRHVRAIAEQLLRSNSTVDVAELNAQVGLAYAALADYYRLKVLGGE
jgi:hypothetical protein